MKTIPDSTTIYVGEVGSMMPMGDSFVDNLRAGMLPIVQPDWISDKKWSIFMYYWWASKLDQLGKITEAAEKENVRTVEQYAYLYPENPLDWCECQFILLDKCDMI